MTSRDDNGHDDNSNDEDDEDDGHPCPSLDNLQGVGHAGGNCGSGSTLNNLSKMVLIMLFCDVI